MLLAAGMPPDAKSGRYHTALELAVSHGSVDCAAVLLAWGAKVALLERQRLPMWVRLMIQEMNRRRAVCRLFYGILRKRWTVAGMRVPRDMITLLTQTLWNFLRAQNPLPMIKSAADLYALDHGVEMHDQPQRAGCNCSLQ